MLAEAWRRRRLATTLDEQECCTARTTTATSTFHRRRLPSSSQRVLGRGAGAVSLHAGHSSPLLPSSQRVTPLHRCLPCPRPAHWVCPSPSVPPPPPPPTRSSPSLSPHASPPDRPLCAAPRRHRRRTCCCHVTSLSLSPCSSSALRRSISPRFRRSRSSCRSVASLRGREIEREREREGDGGRWRGRRQCACVRVGVGGERGRAQRTVCVSR